MPTDEQTTRPIFGTLDPYQMIPERMLLLRCIVYDRVEREYWLAPAEGVTTHAENAHAYLVSGAVNLISVDQGAAGNLELQLLEPPPPFTATAIPTTAATLDEIEIVLEGRRLATTDNMSVYADMRCRVFSSDRYGEEKYWSQDLNNYTSRARAGVWIVRELLLRHSVNARHIYVEVVKEPPLPEGKKCLFAELIPAGTISLLKAAPNNPAIRTQVHAKILVPLPDELTTYEAIVQWVEANIDWTKLRRLGQPQPAAQTNEMVINTDWVVPVQPPPVFSIEVNCTDTETGTCTYYTPRSGQVTIGITFDQIEHAIREADSLPDAVAHLANLVREDAWEVVEMESDEDGDTTYDNYDSDDESPINASATLSNATLRTRLENWLRANQPDELARLQGGEGTANNPQ